MWKALDIAGQVFGRLTAIKYVGMSLRGRDRLWLCACSCGGELISTASNLRSGNSQSCGCILKEKPTRRTHGRSHTPEYTAYLNAKARCKNVKRQDYKRYGGRGIEFNFTSFEQFLTEIGLRPSSKHSLERIENDGHYECGNVRWATKSEQMKNRRSWAIKLENNMNNAVFAGRVGADAELNYTKAGKPVASFNLAINNGKDSEGQERPATWVKAVLWEKRAESLAPYIKKGIVVVVSGPVSVEAWMSKQTNEATARIVVTVREFTFGGGKNDSAEAPKPQAVAAPSAQSAAPIADDDIPF